MPSGLTMVYQLSVIPMAKKRNRKERNRTMCI